MIAGRGRAATWARCSSAASDPRDLPDPGAAPPALDAAGFVVSLEVRSSAVTERADVVLPVAPVAEKAGTFVELGGPFARLRRRP